MTFIGFLKFWWCRFISSKTIWRTQQDILDHLINVLWYTFVYLFVMPLETLLECGFVRAFIRRKIPYCEHFISHNSIKRVERFDNVFLMSGIVRGWALLHLMGNGQEDGLSKIGVNLGNFNVFRQISLKLKVLEKK